MPVGFFAFFSLSIYNKIEKCSQNMRSAFKLGHWVIFVQSDEMSEGNEKKNVFCLNEGRKSMREICVYVLYVCIRLN